MLMSVLIFLLSTNALAAKGDIIVKVDGKELTFEVAPVVNNSRILVPFRAIFESLGVKNINWNQNLKQVRASINNLDIKLTIGSNIAEVNNKKVYLDAPAIAKDGRTLIPLRFVSETLGYDVNWDKPTKTVNIKSDSYFNIFNNDILGVELKMGDSLDKLIKIMGKADRIDKSSKYYDWYIYNKNLDHYIQVGIYNNKIVAFATNASTWSLNKDLKIGVTRESVRNKYGKDIADKKQIKGDHVTFLWDSHQNYIISTLILEEKNVRCQYVDGRMASDLARQAFDLTNVYRIRHGLKPLQWNDKLEGLALYHSNDMVINNFFSHVSKNGDNLAERAEKVIGIKYGIGENIFKGNTSLLEAMNGFYNSEGHRKNILHPNYEYIGIGIIFEENSNDNYKKMLLTQNFQIVKFN